MLNNREINLLLPFEVKYMVMTLAETFSYGHRLINVPKEWAKTKGKGIKIAVVDTGLPVHRDLENQILDAENFTSDPIEDKIVGHSTHVCGIIAAEENNEGVIGVAPKSKLLIAKALGDNGGGTDESLAQAINWCIDKDADIINMSLGAPAEYELFFGKTKNAVKKAYEAGITLVCAAGNENANKIGIPARWEECISVAAVNSKKERANFSNKGPRQDFAAPGVDILSTFKNNTYAELSGTSMASPYLAGVATLILAEHKLRPDNRETPINNPEDLKEHIRKICFDLGKAGHDVEFGSGLPIFGHINENPPPKPPQKNWWDILMDIIRSIFGLKK